MEIFDKLRILVERLEALKQLQDPDVGYLKEQIDKIAYEELPHLVNEVNQYQLSIYYGIEQNEKEKDTLSKLYDLLVQVNETIHSVREQFGLNDSVEYHEQSYEYAGSGVHKENKSDEFIIVLQEIAKSALRTLDIDDTDSRMMSLMGTILLGMCTGKKESLVVNWAFAELAGSGFFLDRDTINDIYKKTHDECQLHILGLKIAIDNIRYHNCSAEETLSQIPIFL